MQGHFPFIFLALLLCIGCGKADFKSARIDEVTIQSGFTEQNYLIRILLPEGYSEDRDYPIVYLLDGHFHFEELGGDFVPMVKDGEIEEVILAGIYYADHPFEGKPGNLDNLSAIWDLRRTDFTYPADTAEDGEILGGGAFEFYRFLTEELAPAIEGAYAVDTNQRGLMGHSFGGYFSFFQLLSFSDKPFYQHVGSLSPALMWQDEYLIALEQAAFDSAKTLPAKLYIGVGSLEGIEFNALTEELAARLGEHAHPGLEFQVETYHGGHLYSANTGFLNALKYFYE